MRVKNILGSPIEKKKKVCQAGGAEVYSLLGVWGRPSPTMASDSTNRQTHQLKKIK